MRTRVRIPRTHIRAGWAWRIPAAPELGKQRSGIPRASWLATLARASAQMHTQSHMQGCMLTTTDTTATADTKGRKKGPELRKVQLSVRHCQQIPTVLSVPWHASSSTTKWPRGVAFCISSIGQPPCGCSCSEDTRMVRGPAESGTSRGVRQDGGSHGNSH